MSFWPDLRKGISSHIRGLEFIARHNLWHYFLYPALMLAALLIGGYWSILQLSDWIVAHGMEYLGLNGTGSTDDWLGWLAFAGKLVVGFILKFFFFIIFATYVKYIVLIICSPVLALLSERIDEIVSGRKYPFNFGQVVHDAFRGMLVALRNMALQTLIIVACFFIGLIPVVGWLTIPVLYVVSWYFLGFSMMDYTYERMRLTVRQGAAFTRRHKGIAIGNGFIFSMILLLPFIGVIIAPILSVVAATLAVLETKKEESMQAQQYTGQGMMQQ